MGQAGTVAGKVAWQKRPAEVKSIELDKQPDLSWGDGAYHVRLGFEDGSAALETLMCSKNAAVKEHAHDKEWEILAVLSGEGKLVRKPGGKTEEVPIAPGTLAANPPGVLHSYVPAGTSPLVAIQLYTPPGPEQRFKKLAADAKK
jgi:mannose-6-phosphate isomerase-like protein (cupin superfamily)